MDAHELHEQDSVLCCAAAPVTAMQFQPRREGLLVRPLYAGSRRVRWLNHVLSVVPSHWQPGVTLLITSLLQRALPYGMISQRCHSR